MSAANRRGGS